MKCTLIYERENADGPCAIWCKITSGDNIIVGKYGSTLQEAREKAISAAKAKIDSASQPIEPEEIEI